MITVMLVDDHPIVRAGLRATLAADQRLSVVAEAGSGEEALRLAAEHQPDVVLMDLQLGAGADGAQTTGTLLTSENPPRVLILTTYDSDADILRAIEAGAVGYLLKDAEPEDLREAIVAASRGETVLAPSVATRLVSRVRQAAATLTPRETEILQLVAAGEPNQAIAKRLFITVATVKSHLVQVFDKLEVENRVQAAAAGRRLGLIR